MFFLSVRRRRPLSLRWSLSPLLLILHPLDAPWFATMPTALIPALKRALNDKQIERVNIVLNYDFPEESDQFLHRVGRAGRFGTKGVAISFISSDQDQEILNQVQSRFEVNIPELPDEIDASTYMST